MSSDSTPQPALWSRLFWSWVLLTLAVLIVAAPVRVWLGNRFGENGVMATWVAVGLCWFAASLALLVHGLLKDPQLVAAAAMGGMLVRMGIIFGGYLYISKNRLDLVQAGFTPVLGGFFLLTLFAETLLIVLVLRKQGLQQVVAGSAASEASEVALKS